MATMDPGQRGFGRPMRQQGPVDRFDEAVGEDRSVDRKHLMALLMSILGDPAGGARNMGRGAPRRPPMGGPQRGGQRPPMGGGRLPVVKVEDLVRALSGGGGQRQAPQADMPIPQARR
jgi:hypothetical protein